MPAAPAPSAPPAAAPRPGAAATAAVPSSSRRGESRIDFQAGSAELSDQARDALNGVAGRLGQNEAERVQINAYAAVDGDSGSQARRLSLSRALAVRAYLIDRGVRSTRLDVRALGNPGGDGPSDRVDLIVVAR